MKTKKRILPIFILALLLSYPASSFAFKSINTKVELIKASKNSSTVDPQLESLVDEISPVLNYTGFTFIKKSEQDLKPGQSSEIFLSSNKILKLTFEGFEDKQGRLLVEILDNKKKVFHTVLLLVDKGFILLGGPKYEDGLMLLRIGADFK